MKLKSWITTMLLVVTGLAQAYTPQQCIAQAVYREARGETARGKLAVAMVVLNRSRHQAVSPCRIIAEPGQFGWYNSRHWAKIDADSDLAAQKVLLGRHELRGFDATSFHNFRVNPRWHLHRVARIGQHIFYKEIV